MGKDMAYDLKIIGATIHDGSGAAPYIGDIAISDGRIVAIGGIPDPAERDIDAAGLIVTPGFIDPHTHYDAQALWDSALENSIRHGVTTAITGNCGVGFAPLLPRDKAEVISLMAGVEDIPSEVLSEGLAWDWSSFAEYLDRLDAVPRPIDLGANVPHDCLRLFVMGARASAQEPATAEDIAQMVALLREALLAGGFSFSFGRVNGHRTADGRRTPSYDAAPDELIALAGVLRDLPYRVLQGVTDGRVADGPEAFDAEYDIVRQMVLAAERPVSLNLHRRSEPLNSRGAWKKVMATTDGPGGDLIRFQVNAMGVGSLYGMTSSINLLAPFPTYRAIAHLELADQIAILKEPETRANLLAEQPATLPGDEPKIASALRVLQGLEGFADRIYPVGPIPNPEPQYEDSLAAYAATRGIALLEAVYDLSIADDGAMLLNHPRMNYVDGDLGDLREMLTHPHSFFGVGDAGAHLGYVCDIGYTTMAMRFWAQARTVGPTIPLPQVVHMLTGRVADHLGLKDRGRIAVGLRADLNLIDHDGLTLFRPQHVADLPAGGHRFVQHARGYRAVIVAGVPVIENDVPTGARPGRLLRAAN
jgi:N-acyl-D-aspartate/D-glutamate deacylase